MLALGNTTEKMLGVTKTFENGTGLSRKIPKRIPIVVDLGRRQKVSRRLKKNACSLRRHLE